MTSVPQTPTNPGARLGSRRVNLPVGDKNGMSKLCLLSSAYLAWQCCTIASQQVRQEGPCLVECKIWFASGVQLIVSISDEPNEPKL